ncbi:DNA cytosine methyltransferase [Shewanella sp. SG44-6]|uniref:DNA cytosine methyltransferase n=1 Tax=Shewanella sp. SG44-6 TaxID=2760959 RepID=UPI0016006FF4|nr:DNA cytosine methyltransferase [Shewanella sp. SG44-6]MBB1391686.1 DNA cytosine methyltransferase [Shewanella sp. SG44-6]
MKGIDLFSGAGGTSCGAELAGVNIIWAANHNPPAVAIHALNHPNTIHACQDLHQQDWNEIPRDFDIVYGSPCCQGHSIATGKVKRSYKADKSRSTAWAIVSCVENHKTPIVIIENVTDFLKWELYDAWSYAMKALGYSLSLNTLNAADFGVPQRRVRLFIVATRSANPIDLKFEKKEHIPARTIIDTNFDGHKWDLVSNRVAATQNRVKNGRNKFGSLFLDAAYGGEIGGRSLDKPIGTIMTVNKHSLVHGDYIRPITVAEQAAAQSFPSNYVFPKSQTLAKMMIGNAVPPLLAKSVTQAVLAAA